jgi:hypothetical protein
MKPSFRSRDLGGATFEDVNLSQARFKDVNLRGSVFRNVNFAEVSIDHANITGLTIFGVPVDGFVRAQLARRGALGAKPAKLSPHSPRRMRAAFEELDKARAEFQDRLGSLKPRVLCRRPGRGHWSALEHVRHLVLAEELYTDRWILDNDIPFSRLGLLPAFLRGRRGFTRVGTQPVKDLEPVLKAWATVHARTWDCVAGATRQALERSTRDVDFGQGTVGGVLLGLLHHDRHHMAKAQAAWEAAAKAVP